jgi:hypothetical protein
LPAVSSLIERLQRCDKVSRYDEGEWQEAAVLVHAFHDLEESCRTYLEVLLPRLTNPEVEGDELLDLLYDVGEEFRHMLYHLNDPRFYGYLR